MTDCLGTGNDWHQLPGALRQMCDRLAIKRQIQSKSDIVTELNDTIPNIREARILRPPHFGRLELPAGIMGEGRGKKSPHRSKGSEIDEASVLSARQQEIVHPLTVMNSTEFLDRLCLKHHAQTYQEIDEVVLHEVSMRHPNQNFAPDIQSMAQTSLGQFCLVNSFVQKATKLIVYRKHMPHHNTIKVVELVLRHHRYWH